MKSSKTQLVGNMKSKFLVNQIGIHEIELTLFNARKLEIEFLGQSNFHFQLTAIICGLKWECMELLFPNFMCNQNAYYLSYVNVY